MLKQLKVAPQNGNSHYWVQTQCNVCNLCTVTRNLCNEVVIRTIKTWNYYYFNHFMALWILSGTTHVSWYQKKHSPTHTYCGHQSNLICFLHLLWSMASSLFNLCAWQSFLHNLSPSFHRSTSWLGTVHFTLHTFLHKIIVFFSQHMPILLQPVLL